MASPCIGISSLFTRTAKFLTVLYYLGGNMCSYCISVSIYLLVRENNLNEWKFLLDTYLFFMVIGCYSSDDTVPCNLIKAKKGILILLAFGQQNCPEILMTGKNAGTRVRAILSTKVQIWLWWRKRHWDARCNPIGAGTNTGLEPNWRQSKDFWISKVQKIWGPSLFYLFSLGGQECMYVGIS